MNTASLLWSLLFGSIGLVYWGYGKRQQTLMPMLAGVALMVYPFFVTGTLAMVGVGAVFMALPFFISF